jgi:hypothetical protein
VVAGPRRGLDVPDGRGLVEVAVPGVAVVR